MDLGLKGRVAIVLAASKGLGRASAAALAAEGANVVIGSRNRAALEQAAQVIESDSGSRVLAVPTDVTRAQDLENIVARAVREFGRIDVLVNNAGGPPPGRFDNFDDAQWLAAYELTFLSVVRMVRLVVPYMREAGGGHIITIVSTSVKEPINNLLLSNAIRPGVIGLTKSLSLELAPDNITVNNVCPGRILTDRARAGLPPELQSMSNDELEQYMMRTSTIPMKRIGKPEELGALVAFLASQKASYITGTTIQIDGGMTKALL